MNRLILTVFLALICFFATAQKTLPGYIVLRHGGDTLRSEVKGSKYKDWHEFKFVYPDGEKVVYKPSQIRAVQYGDRHFISESIDSLPGSIVIVHDGYVLLEKVVSGPLSLYNLDYCEDDGGYQGRQNGIKKQVCRSVRYLQKEQGGYFEAYRKSNALVLKNKQRHSTPQLAGYLKESKVLSDDILYEKISRTSLELICQRYNMWYSTTQ